MERKSSAACYRQFIRIITFIDLAINRKFTLFSLGVLFWLLALAAVAVVTLVRVDATYARILHETIPHELAAQKIAAELATITLETTDLYQSRTSSDVLSHADLLLTRLDEIQKLISTLNGSIEKSAGKGGPVSFLLRKQREQGPYLHELSGVIEQMNRSVRKATADKIEELLPGSQDTVLLTHGEKEMKELLHKAEKISLNYAGELATTCRQSTEEISDTIRHSFLIMFGVLTLALVLLVIFTRWIAVAISGPIQAITGQIHSLSIGDVDLSEKLAITSQDEIGTLAAEFNGLMESVYGMTAFKNVIEEDSHLQDIYVRLGDVFESVAQIQRYCIYEVLDNQQEMVAVYPLGHETSTLHCQGEILADCELCRVCKTGHQISSLVFAGICQQFKGENLAQQHVCVPVNVGGRIGLVVQFLFDPEDGTPLDRTLLQHQVDRATRYLKEAQSVLEAKRLLATLRDSALRDALTGLYNRRFLQEHSQQIVAGCQRRGTSIGLLMCDLDYFKQVNDQYGHETGDLLLVETANALLHAVRESDYVVRFGGEEFLVLLVDVELGEADVVAEKIRHAVAAVGVQTQSGPLSKTISIGVSIFPADGESLWQTIKFADVALYKAKDAGRNQVVHFLPEMWNGDSF
ncbi:MAG: diguanylate cyclase [Desulfuromonadales bacterium]|nr:diguanylate cyclase [Desulfuromonadales bacterium]